MPASPPPRGSKHPRAASAVSRDPKRTRGDGERGDTGVDVHQTRRHPRSSRKRTERDADTVDSDLDRPSEYGNEGDSANGDGSPVEEAENDGNHSISLHSAPSAEDAYHETSVVSRLHDGKALLRKRTGSKAARTEAEDSPSAHKRRVGKGKRDPFITSARGTKAKGKRVLDDGDDHEIGDEWTDLNGLRWRMGEDGEVRREAIVVEMRLKYPTMPRDSRHPDAKLKVPVLVERFLTEAEYEAARSKKLLSFQEEERERERQGAEDEKERELRKGQELQQRRIVESGRNLVTPRRLRNVQALFETSPRGKGFSPLRQMLPYTVSQRSRSLSVHSNASSNGRHMSLDTYSQTPMSLSSSSLTTLSPSGTQHKRLSLQHSGSDDGIRQTAAAGSSPLQPLPMSLSEMPPPASYSTPRHRSSYRVPLVSPASPAAVSRKSSSPGTGLASRGGTAMNALRSGSSATGGRWYSPLVNLVARRKREEGLVKILQQEADRRKQREQAA